MRLGRRREKLNRAGLHIVIRSLIVLCIANFQLVTAGTCPEAPDPHVNNGNLHCAATVYDEAIGLYLSDFVNGITPDAIWETTGLFTHGPATLIAVKSNIVYAATIQPSPNHTALVTPLERLDLGQHDASFLFLLIARAICAAGLPDLVMVYHNHDLPRLPRSSPPLPIFSRSGSAEFHDIMVPYASVLHVNWFRTTFGKVPWSSKKAQAVWRGSQTSGGYNIHNYKSYPRSRLCYICKEAEDICDAGFSFFTQVTPDAQALIEKELGLKPRLDWGQHEAYKYLLHLDGNGAPASRTVPFMFLDSLIIKQDSPFWEFFYPALVPWVHYLPMDPNVTDVLDRIKWAINNDGVSQRIAQASKKFACSHLTDSEITCYMIRLLTQYASLLKFNVTEFLSDPRLAAVSRVDFTDPPVKERVPSPNFKSSPCHLLGESPAGSTARHRRALTMPPQACGWIGLD